MEDANVLHETLESRSYPKRIDCAIIFMLDEERDLFLKANHRFIISGQSTSQFMEFSFVDKHAQLRHGVICSDGNDMGAYSASALFYKLSRRYIASLYINLGVAGILKDINIGDILFVDQLFSACENNANNVAYQKLTSNTYLRIRNRKTEVKEAITWFTERNFKFSVDSQSLLTSFSDNLEEIATDNKIDLKDRNGNNLGVSKQNNCMLGECYTFPEVIKDREGENFKKFMNDNRPKNAVVDMEAFYLSEWHDLIKREEAIQCFDGSEFIAIKSVSDCGDKNKPYYEEAGSRTLAMHNLAEVSTCLCCEVYDFPDSLSADNLLSFLDDTICKPSVVQTIHDACNEKTSEEIIDLIDNYSLMSAHFIQSDQMKSFNFSDIKSALERDSSLVSIYGRSGTGKSTFLSFLYQYLSMHGSKAVYWEIPFFFDNKSPSPRQIIYFLRRLFQCEQNESIILILDGTQSLYQRNSAVYEELSDFLRTASIEHLCISCGDVTTASNPISSIVNSRFNNYTELQFGGVCVDSPDFSETLKSSLPFFNSMHKNDLSEDVIKKLLITPDGRSRVIHVDYLLLYMLSEQANLIKNTNHKYLYTFLDDYVKAKYSTEKINAFVCDIYSSLIGRKPVTKEFNAAEIFRYNPYIEDLAYARAIYKLLKEGRTSKHQEEIAGFFQLDQLFPSDITMIVEDKLMEARRKPGVGTMLLNSLIDMSKSPLHKSREMEMQLIYTACSFGRIFSDYDQLKAIAEDKRDQVLKELEFGTSGATKEFSLRYRSIGIVLCCFFDEFEDLKKYNLGLLSDESISLLNISFHLHYYSGKFFTLQDVISFDVSEIYDEMLNNVFYVLTKQLLASDVELEHPFLQHNLITLLQLFDIAKQQSKYSCLAKRIAEIAQIYKQKYAGISGSKPEIYDKLVTLIDRISKEATSI